MSVFRVFSFSSLVNCRSVLCSRNVLNVCESQKATLKTKQLEKLGIPLPPKRPLTPYIRFAKDIRPQIQNEDPNLNNLAVVKQIAARWSNIDPEKKKAFQKEYLTEMQVYLNKFEKYKQSITPEQKDIIADARKKEKHSKEMAKISKKKANLGRPKKPVTGFFRFMFEKKDNRDITLKYSDWLKGISKEWEHLPENQKQKYCKDSEREMEQYKQDVLAWEEQMVRQGHTDVIRNKELIDNSTSNKSSKSK